MVGGGRRVATCSLSADSSVANASDDGYRDGFAYMGLWGLGARVPGKGRDIERGQGG